MEDLYSEPVWSAASGAWRAERREPPAFGDQDDADRVVWGPSYAACVAEVRRAERRAERRALMGGSVRAVPWGYMSGSVLGPPRP